MAEDLPSGACDLGREVTVQTVRSRYLGISSLGELTFSFSRTKCCPVFPACAESAVT